MNITRHMINRVAFIFVILLTCVRCMAQDGGVHDLQEKFTQYQLQSLQEKIFVHTDKNFYLCGEVIWFKIYNVDESFNKPLDISKVAYAEIIGEDQKAVMQAKIGLQNGMGNGSFIIPSALASGSYKLRSYTSRMKNFGADYYFEQPLTIVNTLKSPTVKTTPPPAAWHIDFFPEGGNLVNGIESVVAFKITDQYGKGIAANGYIINGRDSSIRVQTTRLGMGSFSLLPQKGNPCQAVLKINDSVITKNLPTAYEQGYTLHVGDDAATDILTVTVMASSQYSNLPVYVFAQTRHLVKDVQVATLSNNKAVFRISKKKLGDGISQITVFNAERKPVCERLYCKRPATRLGINILADKQVYAERNKISISLQTTGNAAMPVAADMSMAVFMTDSLQPLQYADIQAWLLLQSDLVGNIESPEYYFSDNSPAVAAALENLMLTQGWRRFDWDKILTGNMPAFEFITENEGPVISAVLTDKKTGLAQKNILTTLTVPGDNFELRSALSRQDGGIRFNLNDFYSSNELIMQIVNGTDSTLKINLVNPFSEKYSTSPFPRFTLSDKWQDQLLNRSVNAQADNAYLIDKKRQAFATPVIDTNVFYGKSEKQYYLDDYTRFITMDEVMREFVVDVRVRKQSDRYQFKVVNGTYKTLFDQDPLVLLDGMPVTNLDKLMALDPLKIKRIDVATHKHYLGPLTSDGIVSYKTYQGDLGGYELDPSAVVIEYDGLQRQREFFAPVYETAAQKESRIPDLRNLLYWSPSVKTAQDGKQQLSFYSSDIKSSFAIVVQGLTADGLAGSAVAVFTVK